MSRSRRRTPISGITTARSNKAFKQIEHRRERALTRTALAVDEDPPHPKRTGNEWASPRDGKQWFGDYANDPRYKNWMRK